MPTSAKFILRNSELVLLSFKPSLRHFLRAISITNHNHNRLTYSFIFMTSSFNPKLESSSGHDKGTWNIIRTKNKSWKSPVFALKIHLKCMQSVELKTVSNKPKDVFKNLQIFLLKNCFWKLITKFPVDGSSVLFHPLWCFLLTYCIKYQNGGATGTVC